MNAKRILSTLALILISGVSIWQAIPTEPSPQLKMGGYRVSTYRNGIVVSHPSTPSSFVTILPYDESIIFSDGSMQKFLTTEAETLGTSNLLQKLEAKLTALNSILLHKLNMEIRNGQGTKISYTARGEENEINVMRNVRLDPSAPQEIAGVEKAVIFTKEDEVLIDGENVTKIEEEAESVYGPVTGVSKVVVKNRSLPETIEITVNPSDVVSVDFRYRVISIQSYQPTASRQFTDRQKITSRSINEN